MTYRPTDRTLPAIGAAAVQGLLLYALFLGLSVHMAPKAEHDPSVMSFAAEPPPPPVVIIPERVRNNRREGEASPPNLRSKATEVVAPEPIVPPLIPPPIVASVTAGVGADASSGAADVPGPGTGSGGIGNGNGSGGSGDGDGGGYGGSPPRHVRGRLKDSDYPSGLGESGVGGTVAVRYLVATDGRVTQCRVTRSSGTPELDETTCRLIRERFRFKPARDDQGRIVPSYLVENHSWISRDDPDPPADQTR